MPPTIIIKNTITLKKLTHDLVTVSNKINSLFNQAISNSDEETENHRKIAYYACQMLEKIQGNKYFHEAVRKLANAPKQNEVEIIKALNELKKFFEEEHRLLKEYNLSMADKLIKEGEKAIKDIKNGEAPATNLHESIEKLRKQACGLYTKLKTQIEAQKRVGFRRRIVKIIIGTGAVVIAVINTQAQASGELDPTYAILSATMGNTIAGTAAAEGWSLAFPQP